MDRTVPQSLEAEQSLLGSMLLDNDIADTALEKVSPDDFYRDKHRAIFRAIAGLRAEREPADLVTIMECLRDAGALGSVGGAAYISTLGNSVPTAANWEGYARIVLEKSKLRRVIETAMEAAELAYGGNPMAADVLQTGARDLESRDIGIGPIPYADSCGPALSIIEKRMAAKGQISGIPSGFIDLDNMTTGWQPGELVIIGGRPSMGKSAFAQCVAEHAAKYGHGVLFITLEMTPENLMLRAISRVARVSADKMRKGLLSDEEVHSVTRAAAKLALLKAWTFGPVGPTPASIRAAVRKLQRESRCDLVVVDYLQLLTSESKLEQRYLEIGQYSRAFKWLALEFKIPVIVLSQLSRSVESTSDKRPGLAHLRESGNIEQDADVVAFLYREDYYRPETDRKGITELIVAKQRNGPVGTVELRWNPQFVSFENLARVGMV